MSLARDIDSSPDQIEDPIMANAEQTASDLDAATKKQLDRGARTVELLKQPQFQPMPAEQQVVVIYAVTNGFLDEVPVAGIKDWERGFREYIVAEYPQVTDGIKKEKVLSKEIEADLRRGASVE